MNTRQEKVFPELLPLAGTLFTESKDFGGKIDYKVEHLLILTDPVLKLLKAIVNEKKERKIPFKHSSIEITSNAIIKEEFSYKTDAKTSTMHVTFNFPELNKNIFQISDRFYEKMLNLL